MEKAEIRPTIPETGIWTLQDLAIYISMNPTQLQQKLSDLDIPVIRLGKRHTQKLIRLRDLKKKEERV